MRSFLLLALLAFLSLSLVSSVSPEYKLCSAKDADVQIQNITATAWPPVKGTTLSLNVTGNNTKDVTSGQYRIQIKVGGLRLPDIDGDISTFKPLPWPVGDLGFTYTQDIPALAPSGNYAIQISAVDQDKHQIFCLSLAFHLSAADEEEGEGGAVSLGTSFSSFLHQGSAKVKQALSGGKAKLGKIPAMAKMRRSAPIRRR